MFAKKSILHVFSVLLIAVFMLTLVGPAYAAPAAQTAEAPSLLQFTSGGHALGFMPQGMYAATGSHALRVDFVNANNVQPQADASASQAATLGRVAYVNLWEGVTLAYTASAGNIYTTTYSLVPGADAKNIRLRYNAPLTLNQNGTLSIAFETGTLTESAPIAWQNINGKRVSVDVRFSLSLPERGAEDQSQTVTFALGKYDPLYSLTIDPTLTWYAFLGGSADDWSRAIAVDGSGNVYVAGDSYSSWGSPVRAYSSDQDGFVAKLNSSGTVLWNTFLGSSGVDAANGVAVDQYGNVYVTGDSSATWTCLDVAGGCTVNAYLGNVNAFAAKLNSSGHLDWNSFVAGYSTMGGSMEFAYGLAIAVDTIRNVVWVAGKSNYAYGIGGKYDPLCPCSDVRAFIKKLDFSGNSLAGSTFGDLYGTDFVNAIAVDGSGNVYVTGDSSVTWGSPLRAHQGGVDAFVAKFDTSATLLWNTFLGGSGTDDGYGIAVDGGGNVYVAGESNASWGSPVRAYSSGRDGFAAKLDSSGLLTWNTFQGGSTDDWSRAIAVDGSGNVYVAGYQYTSAAFAAATLSSSGALLANIPLISLAQIYGAGITVGNGNLYVIADSNDPLYTHNNDTFVAQLSLQTFADVPVTHPLYKYIQALYDGGFTAGCSTSPLMFCPDTILDRAQSAVFMLRGQLGSGYTPPPAPWNTFLADDWTGFEWAQPWAEGMWQEGLTAGCQPSPLMYCPETQLPRVEASVFGLRMKYGVSYTPPPATGTLLADMTDTSYWGAGWAEKAYTDGLLPACGTDSVSGKPLFCPSELVNRGWGAYLIVKAKNLPTP